MQIEKGNMRNSRRLLRVVCLGFALLAIDTICQAQQTHINVTTIRCEQGRILHPTHVSVSIFDVDKASEVILAAKNFKDNSNPTTRQGEDKMFSASAELQKRIKDSPAIARLRSLPTPAYLFQIPPVRRVFVIAVNESESDPIPTYAMKELDISAGQVNNAVLNFSTDEECKGAK
jgi:hypothetical protein